MCVVRVGGRDPRGIVPEKVLGRGGGGCLGTGGHEERADHRWAASE